MSIALDIVVWVALWIGAFGTFFLLRKKWITYHQKYGWTILCFLIFTSLAGVYFRAYLVNVTEEITLVPLVVLLIVYIMSVGIYYFSHKYLKRPTKLIEKYSDQHFIKMDYRYLISKTFDILFQQTMIVILVFGLSAYVSSLHEIIIYFVVLFGIVHLIGISIAGKLFGLYYLVMSLIGAVIFPILILKFHNGFIYSFVLHFSFYSLSSILFWLFAEKFDPNYGK